MAAKIRFYTDENVPKAVINGLRRRGADVVSTPDAGMLGKSDEDHLELATRLGRVIFTQDDDFLSLNHRGFAHEGIVFANQRASISRMIDGLMLVHEVLDPEDMIGHVEFI
jgi:hypothetical protein